MQTSKSTIHMRTNHWLQKETRGIGFHCKQKKSSTCCFSLQIFHPLPPIAPPLACPTCAKFNIEFERKGTASDELYLVQESMINSLFERGAKLTSHKATRMTARFTTSDGTSLRNLAYGNQTLMKHCILSGMLKGLMCVQIAR